MCVFKKHDVVECEVVDGFPFVIGIDIEREIILFFQTIEHLVADPACEESFLIMVQRNGSPQKWVTLF